MLASDLLTQSATLVGLLAGSIAVGGFLGHAQPSLSGESEARLRRKTTIGGLVGLGVIVLAIALSTALQ